MPDVAAPTDTKPFSIRFMFDYGSGYCLWAGDDPTTERFGYTIDPAALDLCPATCRLVEFLLAWYDSSLDWDDPAGPSPWGRAESERFDYERRKMLGRLR